MFKKKFVFTFGEYELFLLRQVIFKKSGLNADRLIKILDSYLL